MNTFQSSTHYAFPEPIPAAETAHIERKMFDLAYADLSPAQALDIYWPAEGNGPFPVILSIHGGAFMGGDKRDVQVTPMLAGLQRGYAVVAINYRMSGEAIVSGAGARCQGSDPLGAGERCQSFCSIRRASPPGAGRQAAICP